MTGLASKLAKGATWMVLARLATRGIGVISTVILARILLPEDFGLMAMAMSIVALIELLRAFGFDTALIQNQQARREHYDTAWTFNVLLGVTAAALVCAFAIPTSRFFAEDRVVALMLALAIGIAIQGFENVGVVDFRKYMQFDRDFMFLLGAKIASFLATVWSAVQLQSYWALVIGILVGRVWSLLASYWMHPFRPTFSLRAHRDLFTFSKWLLLNNFLLFLKSRVADLVIGNVSGARALGLYNISYEISNLPATEVVMPINRAVFSGYAVMADNMERLRRGFINVISVIGVFAVPAGIGIAATAELLVPVALGDKWLDAIPLIRILAIYGVIIAMQTNTLYIYIALGEPRTATILNGLHVALLIPALILATNRWGIEGAAWACLTVAVITTPYNVHVLVGRLSIQPRQLIEVLWRPFLASSAMLAIVTSFVSLSTGVQWIETSDVGSAGLSLVVAVATGATAYTLLLILLWIVSGRPYGVESEVLERLRATRIFPRR